MRRESNPIIRHCCGHTQTHTIIYHFPGELSSKMFNMAQLECSDCANEKMQLEQELNLPPLRGSDRMINWAVNIRLNLAKKLRKYGASDAVEALKRITDAAWFINHREQKIKSIIGILTPVRKEECHG